jgi:3-deoxy-D-manno-octulosonate 8-phosphate phosphatase (KDO 8-P phosphatase)
MSGDHLQGRVAICPAMTPDEAARRARNLSWMLFDVDGVMTDGGLYYGPSGESMKRFHVLDGHGLKALKAAGIRIGILSGRTHEATVVRARELGFDVVVQGAHDKGEAFERLIASAGIDPDTCGHMGDDTPDLDVFRRVAFAATVPDATPDVIAEAHWMSHRRGGQGAVRDCCDFILGSRA